MQIIQTTGLNATSWYAESGARPGMRNLNFNLHEGDFGASKVEADPVEKNRSNARSVKRSVELSFASPLKSFLLPLGKQPYTPRTQRRIGDPRRASGTEDMPGRGQSQHANLIWL
eukprot:765557-Hanusia_phi.AAC.2